MIDRKAVEQLHEAYGLFRRARKEITDVAVRGYHAFGKDLPREVTVFSDDKRVTDTFFGEEIVVTSISRRGGFNSQELPRGQLDISNSSEVVVDFQYPHSDDSHKISVKYGGSATVDGRMVIAENHGLPLIFRGNQARRDRLIRLGMNANTGLSVADTVDSVSAKLLGSRTSRHRRLLLQATLVEFSAGVTESMFEDL